MPSKAQRTPSPSRMKAALDCVPSNWIDPMLTGPEAVIGKPPYTCQDIERVLLAVRNRLHLLNASRTTKKGTR